MKQRSPILGYNHNVRYAGRLWHVQTEDSGVNNPHIFTHLFHDGTILATKRHDYDGASEVSAVQKLMQTQHKAMLRELKAGAFDEKIGKFFGEPVTKVAEDETTDPNAQLPIATDVTPVSAPPSAMRGDPKTDPNLPRLPDLPPTGVPMPPRPRSITPPPSRPQTQSNLPRPNTQSNLPRPNTQSNLPRPNTQSNQPAVRPAATGVGGIGGRRPSSTATSVGNRPTAEGVVVARPAVIIGGDGGRPSVGTAERRSPSLTGTPTRLNQPPPKATGAPAPSAGGEEPRKPSTNENIFGGDLISEKSLDEVILAYLSEDLNEK
jgi:hypothetical protein